MKISNLLKIIFAITLSFSFACCEREDDRGCRDEVVFELDPASRATDTEFEYGDAVGVYAAIRNNPSITAPLLPSGNYAENKKYVFDGTKFVPDGDANTIYTGHTMDYYLYYPYQKKISDPTNFTFTAASDQTGGTTGSDLMLGSNREGSTGNSIPVTFTHALSRLHVSYVPEAGVALKAVTLKNVLSASTINLNGQVAATSPATRSDIRMRDGGGTAGTDFYAIIPAQSNDASANFLSLVLTDNTAKNYKLTAGKEFAAGRTTTIPFMPKELNYTFVISPVSVSAGATAASYDYTCTSTKYYTLNSIPVEGSEAALDYSVSSSEPWITIDKTTKKIHVAENPLPALRSGNVSYTQAESGKIFTLPVAQSSASVRYELYLSTATGNIPAAGGEKTIAGTLNTYYNSHVTADKEEAVTVTLTGSASGYTLSGNKVVAGNNTTTGTRSINVQGKYNSITSINTVTVTQDAGTKQFASWTDWSVSVSASPTTISSLGGTSAIMANAARTRIWTWNGVAGSGGTETDNGTPALSASGTGFSLSGTTLTASNNTGTTSRSCTVTASHSGKSATCTVSQGAGTVTYGDWQVSVSAGPTTISAGGGTSTLSYTATRDILTNGVKTGTETGTPTLSGSANGFTLSGSTVSAGNNTSSSSRSITVTATYSGKSSSCTITQAGGSMTTEYGSWSTSSLYVIAHPTTIAASGGSSTLSAKATQTRNVYTKWNGVTTSTSSETQEFDVSSSSSTNWSGSAPDFSRSGINVTVSSNGSTSQRSCKYTATYDGYSDYITITQNEASVTYGSWSVYMNANPTSISYSGGTSTLTYNASRAVYTNGTQTGTEYATPTVSGSATGFSRNGTTVTVSSNGSTSSRSCTYTASYGGSSDYITIYQDGKPADVITYEYVFTLNSVSGDDVASTGGTVSYNVTSYKITKTNGSETSRTNISWSASANVSWISAGTTSSTVSDNPTTSDRNGTITLKQNESGKTLTISVVQDKKVEVDIN